MQRTAQRAAADAGRQAGDEDQVQDPTIRDAVVADMAALGRPRRARRTRPVRPSDDGRSEEVLAWRQDLVVDPSGRASRLVMGRL